MDFLPRGLQSTYSILDLVLTSLLGFLAICFLPFFIWLLVTLCPTNGALDPRFALTALPMLACGEVGPSNPSGAWFTRVSNPGEAETSLPRKALEGPLLHTQEFLS
uniref:Uncharacterized protein n=1 Tax=Opuntia streptacantha TaxID=393608 RepID=A0A7C9DG94_OPUST